MELVPGFSLFRGLYEFAQYSFIGAYEGTDGMKWKNLSDKDNGLTTVWAIQVVEWFLFMLLALYLDQVVVSSSGVKKHPLFLFNKCFKSRRPQEGSGRSMSKTGSPRWSRSGSSPKSGVFPINMEKADVAQEVSSVALEPLCLEQNSTVHSTDYCKIPFSLTLFVIFTLM